MTDISRLRAAILGARDGRTKPVSIPEWGLESGVFVRSLSINDAIEFDSASDGIEAHKYAPLYLTFALADETGERIFTAEDVDPLCEKDPEVVLRLFHEAVAVNGKAADAGE